MYEFTDIDLEEIALTHPSRTKNSQFQRFEFLGDKLISEVLTKWVIKNKFFNEKQMSEWLSYLICHTTMCEIGQFLINKMHYTGELTANVICDTLEAWIGAIYFDNGNYQKVVLELWKPYLDKEYSVNYKNKLQELCHKKQLSFSITYTQLSDGKFKCLIKCKNHLITSVHNSKKLSSAEACKQMFLKLSNTK